MATRFLNDSSDHDSRKDASADLSAAKRSRRTARIGIGAVWATAITGALVAPMAGCTALRNMGSQLSHAEYLDEFMIAYRNSAWSAKAWNCRKKRFHRHRFLSDMEAGFRQGYEDVAAGGDGCVPTVCPQSYWGWQYQTADGQSRMNAWFEGYPLGVQAAEEDGIGHWSQLRVNMPAPLPASMSQAAQGRSEQGSGVGMPLAGLESEEPTLIPAPQPIPLQAAPVAPPAVVSPLPTEPKAIAPAIIDSDPFGFN